jgi:hypothetical protein
MDIRVMGRTMQSPGQYGWGHMGLTHDAQLTDQPSSVTSCTLGTLTGIELAQISSCECGLYIVVRLPSLRPRLIVDIYEAPEIYPNGSVPH